MQTNGGATRETKRRKRKTTRRGSGEGSIYQRGDDRWCATVTVGYDANGKRRRRTVYGNTKEEVQKKLTRLLGQKLDGGLCDAGRLTVGEFLDQWLEHSVRPNRRISTTSSYRQIVENHLKPFIGGLQMSRLTPSNVAAFYATLTQEGKSPRLVQMAHAVLRRAVSRAVKLGLIARNVCDAVERPKAPRHEIVPLTPDQAAAFLKAAEGDRLHALYVVAIAGGLRQGELYGLKRDDLDLEASTVIVRRTLVEIGGQFIEGPPKSHKGNRRIKLPAFAIDALRDHLRRMLAEGNAGSAYLFCDARGGPLRRQNVQRRSFRPILQQAGLPAIRFHDLRHTSATLLRAQNVHPKVVQERLGHSQISVTLDTYSHVLEGMDSGAADKLGAALLPTGTTGAGSC